jgi:hypothetical protein
VDLLACYDAARDRMSRVAVAAPPGALARRVPACPAWTAHDLVAHCAGIPTALTSGDLPTGDLQAWLDGLVDARRDTPVAVLLDQWAACGEAIRPILGTEGLLLVDVVIHEHDLRGALGAPGERHLADVTTTLPLVLGLLAAGTEAAGLAPVAVELSDGTLVTTGEGDPGWTILADPWEAGRVLGSRRTAAEVLATPARGDARPYLAVLEGHLPLPSSSLRE